MDLTKKKCVPCEEGTLPLPEEQEIDLAKQIPSWMIIRDGTHKLRRQFTFEDFVEAMAFVNKVADIAEQEGHHPDIKIVYNRVEIEIFTHSVGGLSENDFILAAKINTLL